VSGARTGALVFGGGYDERIDGAAVIQAPMTSKANFEHRHDGFVL